MGSKESIFSLILGAAMMAGATARAGVTYDLAGDFMASNPNTGSAQNPNGVWTYGQYTSETIDPTSFSAYGTNDAGTGIYTGLFEWRASGSDPNIVYNDTSSDILPGSGTGNIDFKAYGITFGPSGGPDVARFIAPTTGSYFLNAFFQTVQEANTDPSTAIIVGGTNTVFSNPDEDSTGSSYDGVLSLTAGETVDLVVYGDSSPKSTFVSATFNGVPEPPSIVSAGLGLLVVLGTVECRRRRLARLAAV